MQCLIRLVPLLVLAILPLPPSYGDEKKPQEINGWGKVTDPDGDCTLTEDNGKLMVKVPGTLHDLYPAQKDDAKRLNAPRVLQDVKGDFVVTVKVTADWTPGGKLPGASTAPYNGAGLLVWGEENEFVRLERNVYKRTNGSFSYSTPLQYKGAKLVNVAKTIKTETEFFKGRSTWLKVERVGEKLMTSISHDGKEWIETAVLTAKYPETVRVGVEAVNSSEKESVVEFEEFKVERTK